MKIQNIFLFTLIINISLYAQDDVLPECLLDCEDIEYVNFEQNPYETCDWIISNFGPNNFMNPCAEDCDDETMIDIYEYMERLSQLRSGITVPIIIDRNGENLKIDVSF